MVPVTREEESVSSVISKGASVRVLVMVLLTFKDPLIIPPTFEPLWVVLIGPVFLVSLVLVPPGGEAKGEITSFILTETFDF